MSVIVSACECVRASDGQRKHAIKYLNQQIFKKIQFLYQPYIKRQVTDA